MLAKLFGDFRGVARVAGVGTALRRLGGIFCGFENDPADDDAPAINDDGFLRRYAIDLHDFGRDPQHILDTLRNKGSNDLRVDWYGHEYIPSAARMPAQRMAA